MVQRKDDLRDERRGHGFHELRAGANDAGVFSVRADHESGDILEEQQRRAVAAARLDEVRDLLGALGVDDATKPRWLACRTLDQGALIRDDTDGQAADAAVPRNHLFRVVGLKLVEIPVIEQAREYVVHVVGLPMIGRENVEDVGLRAPWRRRVHYRDGQRRRRRQFRHDLADLLETRLVGCEAIVRDTADLGVCLCAAQRLAVDDLAGRALHEVRAAETHERGILDHEDDVGERRQIRAAGDALAHDRGDLRNVEKPAHDRVVVEDPRGAVLSREYSALVGKVHAGRIDKVDDRHATAHGDLLCAQHLLDGLGPPRPGLDRCIVGHDDDFAAAAPANSGDDAGTGRLPVVLVVGDEESDLLKSRAGVEEMRDSLACGQLALIVLTLDSLRATSKANLAFERRDLGHELLEVRAVLRGHRRSP